MRTSICKLVFLNSRLVDFDASNINTVAAAPFLREVTVLICYSRSAEKEAIFVRSPVQNFQLSGEFFDVDVLRFVDCKKY